MKHPIRSLILTAALASAFTFHTRAVVVNTNAPPGSTNVAKGSGNLAIDMTNLLVGPHHKFLTRSGSTAANGLSAAERLGTKGTVVAIASGLNYWDETQQAYLPSVPEFTLDEANQVFVADRVQHKARVAQNLYTEGA